MKVIPAITSQIGVSLTRVIADAGYRGHKAPGVKGLLVYTSGQKRGVTDQIKRELRRRSAVEPVIGHLKEDHRMGRNYLAGQQGDATNAEASGWVGGADIASSGASRRVMEIAGVQSVPAVVYST
jgi:transposase, IS5 family